MSLRIGNLLSSWMLYYLDLAKLGPRFPKWLQTRNNCSLLDISNAGISDSIPNWFWNLSTEVLNMNLSKDNFSGRIPDPSSELTNYPEIDMNFNHFEGPIPRFLFKVSALHLQ
ncbi:LRR domain containing protein [Parasponia andersonii]|uniref:LRR domain containing protein n=1 Tax=Parasponia andersonii TaxID=3476 RepID=A0A2P5A6Y5_PARAD|nr:LRR domain containing protein [Parasponia andersonii]